MGIQFQDTVYGKRFFEHQLPELIKAINRLTAALEENNKKTTEGNERSDALTLHKK